LWRNRKVENKLTAQQTAWLPGAEAELAKVRAK
jgi:hypothetical protein